MQRREFLKSLNQMMLLGCAGSLPGLLLSSEGAFADEGPAAPWQPPKRFFVLVRAPGGWDVTLGLDPQVHSRGSDQDDMYIEYRADEILSGGGLRFGPACAPIVPFAPEIAVINGVFMSDSNIAHPANLDYISTGDSMGMAPDVTVELAHASEAGPFGILFNSSLKRASRSLMPTTVSNLESLKNSVDLALMKVFLAKLKSRGDFHNSQQSLLKNGAARARLLAAFDALKGEIENPPVSSEISRFAHDSAVVAAAFTSRAAFQAQLDIYVSLDTHSAHPGAHLANQKKVWEAVANLFRLFKKVPATDEQGGALGSLFDNTTFCVVSEFSRTPALNASMGKDHNPMTNSVLLAGAGIQGGAAIGASRLIRRSQSALGQSRHCGALIDYTNGKVAESKDEARQANFQFIFPENVMATVADALQVDRSRFANVHRETPALKTLIRN